MSKHRGTIRSIDNNMKNKLNKEFKSEHVTIGDGRFCKWQTNWHMSILYRLDMPLVIGPTPWYLIYDNDIIDLVENYHIQPCYADITLINTLINQLVIEPEKLITKPRSIDSVEHELHMVAKLHSDFFGIWHITDMKYNRNTHEYDINGISIINNTYGQLWSCDGNDTLFEVIYNDEFIWDGGLYLYEVFQIIDSYKYLRYLHR